VRKVFKRGGDETRQFLKNVLRDGGVRRHLDGLTLRHGHGDFYLHRAHSLRMTPARLKNAGLEVDHTLECQLLAHVMAQTDELRPVLNQLNLNAVNKKGEAELQFQGHSVRNCFRPVRSRVLPTREMMSTSGGGSGQRAC
jgi:hypothetical protein